MSNDNQEPEAFEAQVPLPETPESPEPSGQNNDGRFVHVGMLVTQADHHRMRSLSISLRLSLQQMGHLAWNSFLASQGKAALTPVSAGKNRKRSKSDR